jgi:S-DNA-T family DNA segregation ATPase FtsK/SpoIIIE
VIWALIAALGPAVRSGLCRLWVIDPKGGMELAMGAPMFTRFAYRSAEEIAAALDDAVRVMRARQARLSGKVRVHTPTVSDPLTVVIVDELGALTKYIADVELRRRIEAALGLLLSQGAGLGILVVGALQDPRKENLDLRDLFLSRILLGVTADTHVDMVLGDGMRARGALADQLDASAKGVGYVLPDGMHDPVRVRFPFHDDAAIRALAQEYPAPPDTTAADAVVLTMPSHAKQGARRAATVAGSLIPAALIGALDPNGQGEPR